MFPLALTPLLRRTLLCGLLAWSAPALHADSIEKIPATPEDLGRELGIELDKFEAKFDAPVYITLTLTWKQPDSPDAKSMQHSSPAPDQYHEILFVRKDFGQIQRKTGGANAKQLQDLIEMSVRFGNTGFFYRDLNPFAQLKAGESLLAWSKRQSRAPLPLDEAIPLAISAGPTSAEKPIKNLLAEYRSAPAYVCLSATFSKTAPPAPPAAGQ